MQLLESLKIEKEKLAEERAAAKQAPWITYRQILERAAAGAPEPADARGLAELAEELSLSEAKIADHLAWLKQCHSLEQRASGATRHQTALEDARKKQLEVQKKIDDATAKLKPQLEAAMERVANARRGAQEAEEATRELQNIAGRHPELRGSTK